MQTEQDTVVARRGWVLRVVMLDRCRQSMGVSGKGAGGVMLSLSSRVSRDVGTHCSAEGLGIGMERRRRERASRNSINR